MEVRFQTSAVDHFGACPNQMCGPFAEVYSERRSEGREEEVQ